MIDDGRVEGSDLDRMEYLGILSLESGVFSQRYQNPCKKKLLLQYEGSAANIGSAHLGLHIATVALWVSAGNWEKDRGAPACLSRRFAMPR